MSMPLPMKLRTRLFLSISALITVSLFGLLLGLFSVMQLGRAQEQRMSHHHATIEVSQQLRQLLGDQLVILLRETPDGQALERSQNDFRRVLEQGRANTVDGAEQAALDGVRDAYLQLQAHTPALLKAPMADNDGFSEAFNTLRLRLQDLQQLALAGISDAETSARHRAYLVAGLLGLVGVAILLIGFVTAHSIARRFGAPIETLARAADRIGEGDFDVTLPMTNVAEVGQLTRRFGLMAEALRQYRKTSVEEVLSGERRLQAVLDSIDDGLVIFDNQGRIETPTRSRSASYSSPTTPMASGSTKYSAMSMSRKRWKRPCSAKSRTRRCPTWWWTSPASRACWPGRCIRSPIPAGIASARCWWSAT